MTKEKKILKLFAAMRFACIAAEELTFEFRDIENHPSHLISNNLNSALDDLISKDDPIVSDFIDEFDLYFKKNMLPKIDYFLDKNIKI